VVAKLNAKQLDLLSLATVVIVLVVAYFAIFHRGFTRYFYLKTQEKILRESLKSTATVNQTLNDIQKDITAVEKKLDEFNKRLPKEKNIDEILKQITHPSASTGINLKLIEPLQIREGGIYNRFPIKLHLESPFNNCFHFFLQLENLPRILQLETITMQEDNSLETIKTEMLLSAFIQK
jgi:Tfp pilus assembly protein PilO